VTRQGSDTDASSEPILIAGADRSGTSLMFALLASHPNISMVRRTNMWRWFYGRYGDLGDPRNLDRCLDDLLRYPRNQPLAPDVVRIREEFRAGEPTYGRLFSLFHEHAAQRGGKRRWGDKSLHTEHHVDKILGELPGARVIQMVRDPRDRYASVARRYEDTTRGLGSVMGRWLSSSAAIARNQRRYPENVMTIRYETLARAPEATLRGVCAFVGEPYADAMLRMEGAPDHAGAGGNSSFTRFEPGTISTKSIGRFREVLTPREIAFIQAVAAGRMRSFGYEPVSVPWPSSPERLALLTGSLAVDLARLLGWRAMEQTRGHNRSVPPDRLAAAM
jgi:hypothetical protein